MAKCFEDQKLIIGLSTFEKNVEKPFVYLNLGRILLIYFLCNFKQSFHIFTNKE
jgi:hypothetical protein